MNREVLIKILDLARWAPSGDNTQPWRFEIIADDHIAVHGFDTRDRVLYDFDGRPSQMAHGALIETIRIVSSGFQLASESSLRAGSPDYAPIYDIRFAKNLDLLPDQLLPYVDRRVVQRRPMRMTPLTPEQHIRLERAAGNKYAVQFFESMVDRIKVAGLLWDNAQIRLTCPEAFHVHKEIIEWGVRYSCDRLPEEAIGVDPLTAKIMKWVMQSWSRVDFFNRYLMGTVLPRVQLDLIPAIACAGHILLKPTSLPKTVSDYVEAGVAMQRIWLTATSLGLHIQPEMTPVIFRWYEKAGRKISTCTAINRKLHVLSSRFDALAGVSSDANFVFFCRVGSSALPKSRSLRKSLSQLGVSK